MAAKLCNRLLRSAGPTYGCLPGSAWNARWGRFVGAVGRGWHYSARSMRCFRASRVCAHFSEDLQAVA